MASAEQIRRAMQAEAPPDDVEYCALPVVDVADDEEYAGRRLGRYDDAEAPAGRAEERLRAVMGAAVDEWLSIADWDYQRRRPPPNYIASNPAHATAVRGLHRACLPARERPKPYRGSCGVVRPLHPLQDADRSSTKAADTINLSGSSCCRTPRVAPPATGAPTTSR